jgi:hypothetical protein
MMMRLKVLGWYKDGHIMRRQNGKEGKSLLCHGNMSFQGTPHQTK